MVFLKTWIENTLSRKLASDIPSRGHSWVSGNTLNQGLGFDHSPHLDHLLSRSFGRDADAY